ncbi:MAG: Bax inhibitor-1/YccA family protein [Mycobacteriales bacterium]
MSSNPAFGRDGEVFRSASREYAKFSPPTPSATDLQNMYDRPAYTPVRPMSLDDVVLRTAATLGTVVAAGAVAWTFNVLALALPAALVGFVLALVIMFRRLANPPLVLAYAACEGVFLGAISHVYDSRYPGIVVQAVIGTAGVFAGMLVVYKTGAIRVTPRFNRRLLAGLFGVVAVMLVNGIASLIAGHDALGVRSAGPIGIVFSLVCIALAAAAFLSDFDMIDRAIRAGVPERYAWYSAFGLTVTLVWLYLEILRLLGYARQ